MEDGLHFVGHREWVDMVHFDVVTCPSDAAPILVAKATLALC
jgi:hypothetical protein